MFYIFQNQITVPNNLIINFRGCKFQKLSLHQYNMIFTQYSKRPRYDSEDDIRYLREQNPSIMSHFMSKMLVTGANLAKRTCNYLLPNKKQQFVKIDLRQANKAVENLKRYQKQENGCINLEKQKRKIFAIKKQQKASLHDRLTTTIKKQNQTMKIKIVTQAIDPFVKISKCPKYQMLINPEDNIYISQKQQNHQQSKLSPIKYQLKNEATTILKKQRNTSQQINDNTETIYKEKKVKLQPNQLVTDDIKTQTNVNDVVHHQLETHQNSQQMPAQDMQMRPQTQQNKNIPIHNPFKEIRTDTLTLRSVINNYQSIQFNYSNIRQQQKVHQQTKCNQISFASTFSMNNNQIFNHNQPNNPFSASSHRGIELLLPKNYQSSNPSLFQFPKDEPVHKKTSKRNKGPEKLRIC